MADRDDLFLAIAKEVTTVMQCFELAMRLPKVPNGRRFVDKKMDCGIRDVSAIALCILTEWDEANGESASLADLHGVLLESKMFAVADKYSSRLGGNTHPTSSSVGESVTYGMPVSESGQSETPSLAAVKSPMQVQSEGTAAPMVLNSTTGPTVQANVSRPGPVTPPSKETLDGERYRTSIRVHEEMLAERLRGDQYSTALWSRNKISLEDLERIQKTDNNLGQTRANKELLKIVARSPELAYAFVQIMLGSRIKQMELINTIRYCEGDSCANLQRTHTDPEKVSK